METRRAHRGRRTTAAAVTASAVAALLTSLAPPAAIAAPGDPFDPATPAVFVAQDIPTRLFSSVQGDGSVSFSPEGSAAAFGYNAVGFNSEDNYLYGLRRDTGNRRNLVRIGQDGAVTSLGDVTGLATPPGIEVYNEGTFGSGATAGVLYARFSGATSNYMAAIDVSAGTATGITLSAAIPTLSDIFWKDGFVWGAASNDRMYRINPVTGAVTSWPLGLGVSTAFGAQWVYGNGNIGLSANSTGTIYQIAIANAAGATPSFTLVSQTPGPASGNNDGASIPGLDVDLGIVKSGPSFYEAPTSISYTLTVTNNGPGASSGFLVRDPLPAQVTSATTTTTGCSIVSGEVRCTLGELAVGATRTITVSGQITAGTTVDIVNTATVAGNERDPNPANNQSTSTARPAPDACAAVPIWTNTADGLQQYDPTTFDVLSTTTLTREYGDIAWSHNGSVLYAVDYDGGAGLAPVLRTIDPVTGAELTSLSITGPLLTQGNVPGFGTTNYSLNALTALDANTLLVGSYSSRAIWRLDVTTGATTFWTQFPNQISSAGDFTVLPDGDILAFGVRPLDGNLSNSRAYRIHPNGSMTQIGTVPAMWGGAQSGGYFFMAAPSGQLNRIALATLPLTNVGSLPYTTVLSGGPQFWGASAVQDAGECVGLTITKTPAPAVITGPGQQVTYSFEVTNISDVRIEDIEVTDIQHAPASPLTSGPTCPQSALDPQASMTCTATYLATDADVAHGRIDDTASAAGLTEAGREVISNEATATVTIDPVTTWSLSKRALLGDDPLSDGATVRPGDVVTYEVTVTSEATVDIDGVTLTDDLSAVLDDATFAAGSAVLVIDGGSPAAVPDPAGTTLTAGPFTLPAGTTATLRYDVVVEDDAWSRTLTNAVTGTAGSPGDPLDPEPCTDGCTTTQVTPAVVRVLKVGEDASGDVVAMDGSTWAVYDAADATVPLIAALAPATDGGTPLTGLFEDSTLAPGTYWLEETTALDGFALLADRVEFTIATDGSLALAAGSPNATVTEVDGIPTIRVEDVPALDLPEAGGSGATSILLAGGVLLTLGALAAALRVLTPRRRARKPPGEDLPAA